MEIDTQDAYDINFFESCETSPSDTQILEILAGSTPNTAWASKPYIDQTGPPVAGRSKITL